MLARELEGHPAEERAGLPADYRALKERNKNPPFDPKTFVKHRGAGVVAFELGVTERQVRAHETALGLLRDPRVLDLLVQVTERAEVARAAARDPRAFARSQGVELPPGLLVEVEPREGRTAVRATAVDEVEPFAFEWDGAGP